MFGYFKKHDHRLWILSIGWFSSSVGFALSIPFISIYFHSDLGISLSQIGIFFGVAAVVRSISHSFGGELSDKIGRYWIMVLAQFLRALTFVAVAYSIHAHWGFYGIGGVMMVNFIFGSFFQPAANATVADLVEARNRTEGYAIVRVAGNLGWAVGPALGGYLAADSYAGLFIASAIMTIISGGIIMAFLKGIARSAVSEGSRSLKESFSFKGNEIIYRHAALVFVLYLVIAQMIAPFSLYAVDFKGISKEQLGSIFAFNGLMVTFLQIPITRMLRKVKLTDQLAIGSVIYAFGFLMVGLTSTYAMFVIAFVIITTGENFVSPPALSISANLAPEGRVGRYMGIYGFAVTSGWSLGPLIGGLLLDWSKPDFIYMWAIVAALVLVSAIGFRRLGRHIPAEMNLHRK